MRQLTYEPILITIFIVLVAIFAYLVALPNILEDKGIDLNKLKSASVKKKKAKYG